MPVITKDLRPFYGCIYTGQGAVVLTNSDTGEDAALQLIKSIATVYDWPVMKSYTGQKLLANEIQDYKGRYQTAKGAVVEIGEDKKSLALLTSASKAGLPMYKIGEGIFTLNQSPDFVRLLFGTVDGNVKILIIAQKLGKIDELTKME